MNLLERLASMLGSTRASLRRPEAVALLVLSAAASIAQGCAGDACEQASDKLADECKVSGGTSSADGGTEGECSGPAECSANCVVNASCEEIVNPSEETQFQQCVKACAQEP